MKFQNIIQPFYLSFPLLFPYSIHGLKHFEKTDPFLRKVDDGRKGIAHGRSLTDTSGGFDEQILQQVNTLVAEVDSYSSDIGVDIMQTLIDAEVIYAHSDGSYSSTGVVGMYLINEIYKKLGISGSFDLNDPCDGEYGPQMCESRNNAISICQQDPTCDDIALASVPLAALEGSVFLNTELAAMLFCISQLGFESLSALTLTDWQISIGTCDFLIESGNQGQEGFVNITQEVISLQGLIEISIGFDHPILNLGHAVDVLENELLLSSYSPPLYSIAQNITSQNDYFDLYVADISIQIFLTVWPALVDFENEDRDLYEFIFRRESATAYVFAKYSNYINDDIIGYFDFRGDINNTDALFGVTASKAITPRTFEQLYAVQDDILEVVSNPDELEYEVKKFVFNFFL